MTYPSAQDLTWDTPPPPAPHTGPTAVSTVAVEALVSTRPGRWASFTVAPGTSQASIVAYRLRARGLEAVSRGHTVYVRMTLSHTEHPEEQA